MKSLLFIVFLIAFKKVTAQADQMEIHKRIDSIFSEYDSLKPGVAIAIVRNGKIDFKKGYGLANLEYDIPITTETKFQIASVSKQFTAFAIYLLRKKGKLSLEDDVRKYIPALPDYDKVIKIKHLLAHTSGLRDQSALLTLAGWQMEDIISLDQILKIVCAQQELNFETDSRFGYSNTGYTLLAEVVSKVSGESFAEFTRKNIFLPLGMNNTLFNEDFHDVIKNRAYSYELSNGKYAERRLNYLNNVGSTNLLTTVEDLAKWVTNFDKPVVGDFELLQEFNKVSEHDNGNSVVWAAAPGDTTYHAKGQLHWKHKGLKVISHGGHDASFRAVLTRFPENNLAIITLSNNEHYQMIGKVLPVADLYLKSEMVTETPHSPAPVAAQKKEAFSNVLTDYPGNYASEELSTEYRIEMAGNKLIMTHRRLPDIVLTEIGADIFSGMNGFPFEIQFVREGNKIRGFTISNWGVKDLRFVKK